MLEFSFHCVWGRDRVESIYFLLLKWTSMSTLNRFSYFDSSNKGKMMPFSGRTWNKRIAFIFFIWLLSNSNGWFKQRISKEKIKKIVRNIFSPVYECTVLCWAVFSSDHSRLYLLLCSFVSFISGLHVIFAVFILNYLLLLQVSLDICSYKLNQFVLYSHPSNWQC